MTETIETEKIPRKRPKQFGPVFEGEVSASARHLGIYHRKLQVGTLGTDTRFTLKSPYDCFLLTEGRFAALELKSLKEHGSFPLGNLQDHQVEGLEAVLASGGAAYLLINMRRQKDKPQNAAWYLDFNLWGELQTLLARSGRKSVPYDFFQQEILFRRLERARIVNLRGEAERVWDLRPLFPDVPLLPGTPPVAAPASLPADPDNPWAAYSV